MKCLKCGKESNTGEPYCAFCGQKLPRMDPFHDLGDLSSTKMETAEKLLEASRSSKAFNVSEDANCFANPGDLSGERTTVRNSTEKSVDQQPQYEAMGKTGFAKLGDLSDSSAEHRNVSADKNSNNKLGNMHVNHKSEERSKERKTDKTDHCDVSGKQHAKTGTFSKKKWTALAACLAIVMLLVICAPIIGAMLKSVVETDEEQAVAALDDMLDIPINEINTEGIETPAFLIDIEERNGYEILKFEKTESGAVALILVYAPDVYGVAKELDANGTFSSEADLSVALSQALQNAPIIEKQVSIYYTLTENGYVPNLTAEFLDAYYGGVYRLRDEIMSETAKTEG